MRLPPLVFALALIAAPALAADDDAPMTTAPAPGAIPGATAVLPASASEAPMTVSEQIGAFLRTSPARDVATGDELRRDRKVHGEIAAAVGSHGYRGVYARADIPVGESGLLSVAVAQSEGGRLGYGHDFGYGYGPGPGYGLYAPGPRLGLAADPDRRRCGLEAMTPPRPLDDLAADADGPCARRR